LENRQKKQNITSWVTDHVTILVAALVIFVGGVFTFRDLDQQKQHTLMMQHERLEAKNHLLQERISGFMRIINVTLNDVEIRQATRGKACADKGGLDAIVRQTQEIKALYMASPRDGLICGFPKGYEHLNQAEIEFVKKIALHAHVENGVHLAVNNGNSLNNIVFYKKYITPHERLGLLAFASIDTAYFNELVMSVIDDFEADDGISSVLAFAFDNERAAREIGRKDGIKTLLQYATLVGVHAHDMETHLDLDQESILRQFNAGEEKFQFLIDDVDLNRFQNDINLYAVTYFDVGITLKGWRKKALMGMTMYVGFCSALLLMVWIIKLNERRLRKATEEAQAANLAKGQFLSHMSHELRTPLNAVIGYGQLLRETVASQEGVEYCNEIQKAGKHLLKLISDILDFSVVEAGKYTLDINDVNVEALLMECIASVKPLADASNVEFDLHVDKGVMARADITRLRQVVLNLLSNAIKYGKNGGKVTLVATDRDHQVKIVVKDQGTGIPAHLKDQLFIPFNRLDAVKGTIPGAGLGLALSKQLALAMGGQMGVESNEGEGAAFWVTLPHVTADRALAATATNKLIANDIAGTVLYVEDNVVNAQLMKKLFSRLLPNVVLEVAHTCAEGLRCVQRTVYHVVLLDMHLPDCDGIALLHKLRAIGVKAPCFAVTADASPQEREGALQAGFQLHLTKPLNATELQAALVQVLSVVSR